MPTKRAPERASGLSALYATKLAQSQIGDTLAKKLKFKLRDRQQPIPFQMPSPAGGFSIPYFDLKGKPTSFLRYRYLENPDAGTPYAGTDHKPIRYVQPPDSINELYLPPLVDWELIAADAARPIIMTEGELKSACATAYTEFPTIGLGGVWCFRSGRNHLPLLPMFKNIRWDGRKVYIAYDSDTSTNPKVQQAQNKLASELLQLGATPMIVSIPAHGGAKQGLDDFIVNQGAEAVPALLHSASDYAAFTELHKLNAEVIYVRNPGQIIKLETGQRLTPRSFYEHAFSNRTFEELQTTDKGSKSVTKSAPREWLKWRQRTEVERAVYAPGRPQFTEGMLNTWTGWGCDPKRGDVGPWRQLLDHIFRGNAAARKWFEQWCAYPIQHPGTKLYTAPVIWGRTHGTGKSFIGYSLFKIYGNNAVEIKDADLHASFNGWAENRQFVMGDEITGGDKRGSSDRLKSIITQQKVSLNIKYQPTYELVDCINYYFTSNHADSFFIEDKDRRYFVWEFKGSPLPLTWYRDYETWIGSPGQVGPGASALFYHLAHVDLTGFDPRGPAPETDSKRDMMQLGRSDIGNWVATLRESPDTALRWNDGVINYNVYRSEDLLALYDPDGRSRVTVNGMSRELRRAGFEQAYRGQPVPTKSKGSVRLWVVRPIDPKIAESVKVGQLYDDERIVARKAK